MTQGKRPFIRLVCIPYAGGSSAAFYRWNPHIPASVELLPLELPGRDGHAIQPALPLTSLAATLADGLTAALDRPVVLLGHSMGAWLAFELTRELRRRRLRMPELLVVAASRAPHLDSAESAMHDLPDDEFLAAIERRFGRIPTGVRDSPAVLQRMLPTLRADIQMVETYECVDEPPLNVEILAMGGADDRAVSTAQLAEWRRHTTGEFTLRLLPGGHFFLFDTARSEPASKIARSVKPPPALKMLLTYIERRVLPRC